MKRTLNRPNINPRFAGLSAMTLSAVVVVALLGVAALVAARPAVAANWYESNPTYTDPRDDTADWQISTPEAQGMSSAMLAAGGDSISTNGSIFSLLVIRHDNLVYERYYHGSDRFKANNIHSASKSMLQALINIAIQQGSIPSWDTKVSSVLPEYFLNYRSMKKSRPAAARKKNMAVKHLMQMSSGLNWVEDESEYTLNSRPNWVQAIIDLKQTSAPGTVFNYSTGNAHVASNVIEKATGMKTHEFAAQYLFGPMGITVEHWGHPDPQGVDSGGCNVYMTPREMAKFGMLYLNNGLWNGEQLVPTSAVTQAATKVWQVDSTYGYSTGWWTQTISGHPIYFAWGWGGQFIYVIPDLDIVMVTSENTADSHNNVEINDVALVKNYIIPAVTGP